MLLAWYPLEIDWLAASAAATVMHVTGECAFCRELE